MPIPRPSVVIDEDEIINLWFFSLANVVLLYINKSE